MLAEQKRTYSPAEDLDLEVDTEGRRDTIINPCLMAEILSASTQNYDSPLETLGDRNQTFAVYY